MILIKNATILTLLGDEVIYGGEILIQDSTIQYAGPPKSVYENVDMVIDASNHIAMPGFVNSHTHLAMTLMRGIADDIPLQKWLNDIIFPIEDKLTEEDVYFGTLLALIESIRTGTTTVSDFYMFPHVSAKALGESGLRGNIGVAYASKPLVSDKLILERAQEIFDKFNEMDNGRIIVSLAPHAPYTCSQNLLKGTGVLARKLGAVIQIHLHETEKEVLDYKEHYGQTPIEYLDSVGFFDNKVIASHCVWVSENDLRILENRHVGVASNPQSNLKLGSGIPPIDKFLKHNLAVSIGTDGASSNNNLSVLEDMRLLSLIAKGVTRNPENISAPELLRIATLQGSLNLGFENVGRLKEGYKADIIIIDASKANMIPSTNPHSLVAYSMYPEDVDTVIVDGKILMKDRILLTIDEEFVKNKVKEKFIKISKLLNKNKKNSTLD